ncbi:uncharacterized protein SAPINGB_P001476 [Magnusiomyces paraingens]|uniref:Dipeptidyl peptidase 3 n=1 Tax=Magnusiomyces paraingens TaxID=2606893 RepID=A0A5E8B5X5_9ASCO|nr:uncharacterized protein SAPINGB_P001476 [Saprochaete ingens]VVT46966.1 unnamed protein product [Saprochaete ingens]
MLRNQIQPKSYCQLISSGAFLRQRGGMRHQYGTSAVGAAVGAVKTTAATLAQRYSYSTSFYSSSSSSSSSFSSSFTTTTKSISPSKSYLKPRFSFQSQNFSTMAPAAHYYADTKAPITPLEVKHHFELLADNDKHYAHHMSRASHFGTRVVLRQVSPESETIYDIILSLHATVKGIYDETTLKDASAQDVQYYLEYASQFLSNLGNYKSFGDVKFVPRLTPEAFKSIVSVDSKALELYNTVEKAIFSTEPEAANLLGYADKGHVTSYYSPNVTKEEIDTIQGALAAKGVLPENTRLFKDEKGFKLLIASANTFADSEDKTIPHESIELPNGLGTLEFVYGDHSKEFAKIVEEMEGALKYAANETQEKMLKAYIQSFKTGSMEEHKESQKYWVKDIGPKVETNIGFIETYRDPAGIRGEWEGLVAMINTERTKKFSELVEKAKDYIGQLPWPKAFEKDVFTPPDFTSLEVLTFAGSGIPAGINIPNYDDVRLNVGFKNVSLGNVLSAKAPNEKTTFLKPEDAPLHDKLRGPSFEVQVGIHELLGHGTGKLLSENSDGTFNFDKENPPISPITGKPVTTYYKKGETWGSVFGSLAGSYEECRAETVAMYLATDKSLLKIFGHGETGEENADDVLYIAYLMMARAGLLGLEFWDPITKKWGQPHMQARFSILKCFLNAGEDFVKLETSKEDYSDLVISLDRSKILSVGKKAVGDYLQKLHIYKTTADYANGSALYNEMTEVGPELAKFRDIVIKSKLPRKQFVQANTVIEDGKVVFKEYESTPVGMIESFAARAV